MRRRIIKSWHRFYDPSTGRYISADPIGLAGGINLYGYVGGNPVNIIDPKGLGWGCKILVDGICTIRYVYVAAGHLEAIIVCGAAGLLFCPDKLPKEPPQITCKRIYGDWGTTPGKKECIYDCPGDLGLQFFETDSCLDCPDTMIFFDNGYGSGEPAN